MNKLLIAILLAIPVLSRAANPSFGDTYGSNGVLTAVTGTGGSQKIAIGFKNGAGGFLANASGVLVNGGSGALHWAIVSNTNLFNSDQFAESAGIVSIKTTAFVTNLTVFTELFVTNASDHFATLFLQSSNHTSTLGIDTALGQTELISDNGIVADSGIGSTLIKANDSGWQFFQGILVPGTSNLFEIGQASTPFKAIYGNELHFLVSDVDGVLDSDGLSIQSAITNDLVIVMNHIESTNDSEFNVALTTAYSSEGLFWSDGTHQAFFNAVMNGTGSHLTLDIEGTTAFLANASGVSLTGQPNVLSMADNQLWFDGVPIGPPLRVPYYTNNIWVATNGNDSTATFNDPLLPALTPTNAIAMANSAGGFCNIVLLSGVYDTGTNVLFVPTNSNMIGVGGPLIRSSARLLFQQNPTIVPADNSVVEGITFTNTFKDTDFTAAWGTDSSRGFTNAFLIRCRIKGGTDGVYVNCPLEFKQYTVYQCIIDSDWDQLVMFDSNTVWLIKDCTFIGHGPWAGDTGQPVHGPIIRGTGEISGCTIVESGPNSDNVGILNSLFSGSEGTFEICGTTFDVSGTFSTNIIMNTASTLTICDNAPEGSGFGFPSGVNVIWPSTNSVGVLTNNATGDLGFATSLGLAGTIATGAPAGSTNPTWKLGGNTNGVSVIAKSTNTLVIAVGGVNLYLPYSLTP